MRLSLEFCAIKLFQKSQTTVATVVPNIFASFIIELGKMSSFPMMSNPVHASIQRQRIEKTAETCDKTVDTATTLANVQASPADGSAQASTVTTNRKQHHHHHTTHHHMPQSRSLYECIRDIASQIRLDIEFPPDPIEISV
ncbi:hypothetical protein PMAYCL1PPCAC_32014 [Pristionchus mayeri]|uniref:Uncharacterized protein n=1 Tax=Pristionchus mayeri TaxID=1317129 RepID=A0AAN5DES0_9BILA|nr:hypothetical protein PMAYCL1PPCAC_32014 [Pristionchus mayeri]